MVSMGFCVCISLPELNVIHFKPADGGLYKNYVHKFQACRPVFLLQQIATLWIRTLQVHVSKPGKGDQQSKLILTSGAFCRFSLASNRNITETYVTYYPLRHFSSGRCFLFSFCASPGLQRIFCVLPGCICVVSHAKFIVADLWRSCGDSRLRSLHHLLHVICQFHV